MSANIPYTYLIGWPELNKWYYGVRYAKNCHPTDLWTSYFTSSKLVKKFVDTHGAPPLIEVRRTFSSIIKAQNWEAKVLRKLQVATDSRWLNGHDSKAFDPSTVPKGKNHWTKQDTVAAHKWRNREGWKSRDASSGIMPSGNNHWTAMDTDAAKRHKERMHGPNNPNNLLEVREKKSRYLREHNPVFDDEVKKKISNSLLGKKRPRKTCEYCKKNIADSIYTKFHGDKCNHKI